jgi:signal transduction histidine kinase
LPEPAAIKQDKISFERLFGDVPAIDANREQVLQAVENLLSNALDAMRGGGTLTVVMHQETAGDAPYVRVDVQDTGGGIAQENLSRIFEPFFTTKLLLKGTGIGLSIAIKVMEDHGGFMRVGSEVGRGSTFSLYFPYRPKG